MEDPYSHIDPYDAALTMLGSPGRMLSGSKQASPERKVVWNANVLVNSMKIWFGDISITESSEQLQELANHLGGTIYVLYESDARFENEANPLIENAVASFEPSDA